MAKGKKEIYCSFCGKSDKEVILMVEGMEAEICNVCIVSAFEIVKDEDLISNQKKPTLGTNTNKSIPTPKQIKAHLDAYVIGQDEAKRILSVAVHNHFLRLENINKTGDVELEKSNIILIGETGTGKTLLAKSLAKYLNVPFCMADATVLTEAGYVGDDVESILSRLLQVANYDADLAQRGIIFLDEMDKIARKGDTASITRDVSGEGVQQGLLKIIEGTIAHVAPEGGRKHPDAKYVKIDTSQILFICGGAFDGIQKIISKRLNQKAIGFGKLQNIDVSSSELMQYATHDDLKSFGIIPELLGRLPVLASLNPLDKSALMQILTEPKNALVKQFQKLFELKGIQLDLNDKTIEFIAEQAIENKLGARGLRSILEIILQDYMFDIDNLPSSLEIDMEKTKAIWSKNAKRIIAAA